MPFFLSPERLRKKLTVIGMMGHTQGVTSATSPPSSPNRKIFHNGLSLADAFPPWSNAFSSSTTGVQSLSDPATAMPATAKESVPCTAVKLLS